ncbi:MAG: nicotinate phosphoribosyltransferase [Acidobacteriota bacterium]
MSTTNRLVNPLLTDLYELTMAYAYWKHGRHEEHAVFDLFFRKNPFRGEFTVFAGLEEVLSFLEGFRYSDEQVDYLRTLLPESEPAFFEWLRRVDLSGVTVHAVSEGSIVFPRVPLLRVEGPLALAQLLETTLLTLVNYPSLVATNAARFRLAAGMRKTLLEFGLRRAQGPDGGMSASRYAFMGGFDATSNVLAGMLFGIPPRGTHAHSYVQSFQSLEQIPSRVVPASDGQSVDLVERTLAIRDRLRFNHTNQGELAAFVSYALAFPESFLALVDTYDTLNSGVPNFICVAFALMEMGHQPIGVRLDSGDLAFLSKATRNMFASCGELLNKDVSHFKIAASNDIDEAVLMSLNSEGHEIDIFGIGTRLVTCESQPALGCVYKLVEIGGSPRIKLSQDLQKVTIPGRKEAYRLYGQRGFPLLDLMVQAGETPPHPGDQILCRHPFDETKRVLVTPSRVMPLHQCVWNGGRMAAERSIHDIRADVLSQLASFRQDHLRLLNPTPYKVSVSAKLYDFIHRLWVEESPLPELR